jgi:hypothetical protein
LRGSDPQSYEMSMDDAASRDGHPTLRLRSRAASSGFGTVMRLDPAEAYLGKRIRLSAMVKCDDVRGWVGLWLRVDGEAKGASLAFDNMQDRPILGTRDWARHEIVLPVAREARQIAYGLLLGGEGGAWLDDLRIEVVADDVPATGRSKPIERPKRPVNLGFEEQ